MFSEYLKDGREVMSYELGMRDDGLRTRALSYEL